MFTLIALIVVLIAMLILLTIALQPPIATELMDPIDEGSFPFPVFIINLDRKPERYKYVTDQLDSMNITNYQRISGTDGFKSDPQEIMNTGVSSILIDKGKGVSRLCSQSSKSMEAYC